MSVKESLRQLAAKTAKLWLQRNARDIVPTMTNLGRARHIDVHATSYTNEYIRLSTFDLVVDEIERNEVEGSIAELGVYKGDFAAVMNVAFPERKMYLFDTFEGFDASEEASERKFRELIYERDFSDTSVEMVMARMPNPLQCVVRKGLFPATAAGLEDKRFCFVSIDTDLYDPIKAGLSFFYPRLNPGGFIFVHDYNNNWFPGARIAVREFCVQHSVPFVPITDAYGTAVFAKR